MQFKVVYIGYNKPSAMSGTWVVINWLLRDVLK